jgi:hypothetical protein
MWQTSGFAELSDHVVVAGGEGIAGDHLGHDQARPEALRQASHGGIGDASHGCEEGAVRQRVTADAYAAGKLSHKMPQKCSFAGIARTIIKNHRGATTWMPLA